MHRDLRSVGLLLATTTEQLRATVAPDHPLLAVGQHLHSRAVEIDRDLALLRKLSGPSKKVRFGRAKEHLQEFRTAIDVYESTAAAVTRSLRPDRSPDSGDAIRDLNDRMTALKQAIDELDDDQPGDSRSASGTATERTSFVTGTPTTSQAGSSRSSAVQPGASTQEQAN